MKKTVFLLIIAMSSLVVAEETWLNLVNDSAKQDELQQDWRADGGTMDLLFFYDLLDTHGIQVEGVGSYDKNNWTENHFILPIKDIGGLSLKVPYGNLIGVDEGALHLSGSFTFRGQNESFEFKGLRLQSSKKAQKKGDVVGFELINDLGQSLFQLDHVHATLDEQNNHLNMANIDVTVSATLAKLLGQPELQGLVVAQAHIQSNLTLPLNGYVDINDIRGGACAARPLWPGDPRPSDGEPAEADVALIEMQAQQRRNLGNGHVVITPSATLRNVGDLDGADVAWYAKFSGTYDPYGNAQHPFLVWNMYREIDGRFEQIGVSGVKHAFLTINSSCTINCGDSHILWPGCEDIYGMGNNDSGSSLGPREGIEAYPGLWEQQCSFFDQDCNNSQDNSSNGTDENRMVVADANLGDSSASYYISAWYVIRDDINIYNTMGYKPYAVSGSAGNWSLSPTASLTTGPASDQYVSPDTIDLVAGTASQRILQAGEGHLTVAVKVNALAGGLYRYNYMIENFDYDPQVQSVSVPLSQFSALSDFVFVDTDENASNDWNMTHTGDMLTLTSPAGNELDWGILYSFSFTTDAEPTAGDVTLVGLENGGSSFNSAVIVPNGDDLIFENSFE